MISGARSKSQPCSGTPPAEPPEIAPTPHYLLGVTCACSRWEQQTARSSVGRAEVLQTSGRGFESLCADQHHSIRSANSQ